MKNLKLTNGLSRNEMKEISGGKVLMDQNLETCYAYSACSGGCAEFVAPGKYVCSTCCVC